jgi:hypothetical protein
VCCLSGLLSHWRFQISDFRLKLSDCRRLNQQSEICNLKFLSLSLGVKPFERLNHRVDRRVKHERRALLRF